MGEAGMKVDATLRRMFDQMPGCWGCKDANSVFMYANKAYADIIGVGRDNHLDIIGRTDFDMPCETVNCAEIFRKQDKEVMAVEKSMRILDIHPFAGNKWKAYIFTKTSLYDSTDQTKVIGTIFHGADITNSQNLELGSFLSRITEDVHTELLGGQTSFLLSHEFNEVKLSAREAETLFFILRGKTAKQIARVLGISDRTVHDFLERLKIKFAAFNKSELIDKAIQAGFLNCIPERLYNVQLSVALRSD
jgi:DNA-binding CsgD family transcriptional regulator